MNKQLISERLRALYGGDCERIGFILADDSIVEVWNIAPEPSKGFLVSAEDVLKYEDAVGTWHTHPNETANLSPGDYETFMAFGGMDHFIVGNDGTRAYEVKNGRVLCAGEFTFTAI